ncbi:eppin-like [Erythrolamprus reginae]|uniref:eppin-like n=1 Tax=Erythrolamprus reginae TaxID=121349 RepID=UPI00396C798A
MKAQQLLLALALLVLGAQGATLASKEDHGVTSPGLLTAKEGYCYNVPPLGDVFDTHDCSDCRKNDSCSTCARDDQCPGTQKCCPGECGYTCEEAVMDVCQLPSVCGICKAMFLRFFYNVSTDKCEQFIYGGCGGNMNNFESMQECLRTCRVTKA